MPVPQCSSWENSFMVISEVKETDKLVRYSHCMQGKKKKTAKPELQHIKRDKEYEFGVKFLTAGLSKLSEP